MKMKKQMVVLPVIIAFLIFFLIVNNQGTNIKYSAPEPEPLKAEEVTKIVFGKGTDLLTLVKNGDVWQISPQQYNVDKELMDDILQAVINFKPAELISDKQAYKRYELDDAQKITLKAYKNDAVKRHVYLGKLSSANHTFVAIEGNPNIYSVNSDIVAPFIKGKDAYRDKTVLEINKDSITEITINFTKENNIPVNVKLNKVIVPVEAEEGDAPAAEEKIVWKLIPENKEVKDQAVNEILNTLSPLLCEEFVPDDQKPNFSNPHFTITLKGDKTYSLTANALTKENKYPAISSQNKSPAYIIGWKMNRLKKDVSELVKEEK